MGLYNNEIPTSVSDGFTPKIKQNITQCSVNPDNLDNALKMNNPVLVDICQIPSKNDKINKLIEKGTFKKEGNTNMTMTTQNGGKKIHKKYNIKWV
jgi:hypothetical protein